MKKNWIFTLLAASALLASCGGPSSAETSASKDESSQNSVAASVIEDVNFLNWLGEGKIYVDYRWSGTPLVELETKVGDVVAENGKETALPDGYTISVTPKADATDKFNVFYAYATTDVSGGTAKLKADGHANIGIRANKTVDFFTSLSNKLTEKKSIYLCVTDSTWDKTKSEAMNNFFNGFTQGI